jgi:ceramide glucosyltransferase
MVFTWILGGFAFLSFAMLLWQWFVAHRFPLHQRVADKSFAPAVTLLKPLKGCDTTTADSLRSWLAQDYPGAVQVLFGVASDADPVCKIARGLLCEFPQRDAQLVVCDESLGVNAKVSKLIQLQRLAKHDTIIVSDADVRVPPDLLVNVVAPLREEGREGRPPPAAGKMLDDDGAHPHTAGRPTSQMVGLTCCFYRLANPTTPAMRWEAVAVNADFWSQVLQSRSLKPLDFALGAAMAVKREALEKIGGFAALADYLADDYQLGNKIVQSGWRIKLCPIVVDCWSPPMDWKAVWKHQLRWARTIRVCQPAPYVFSVLSNATLWPLLWLLWQIAQVSLAMHEAPHVLAIHTAIPWAVTIVPMMLAARITAAVSFQARLTQSFEHIGYFWAVPVKDLLQAAAWLGAFAGNKIEWRGDRYRLARDGKLAKV